MLPEAIKAFYTQSLKDTAHRFLRDVESMPDEQLADSPAKADRCPCDYVYEVGLINRRIVCRLRGEKPAPLPDGFVRAPDEYRTKAKVLDFVRSTFDELLAEWDRVPAADLMRVIELEGGQTSSPLEYAHLADVHCNYHDGQLNLMQSMAGDQQVHW